MSVKRLAWNTFVWEGVLFYRISWWGKEGASSISTPDKVQFKLFLREKYEEGFR